MGDGDEMVVVGTKIPRPGALNLSMEGAQRVEFLKMHPGDWVLLKTVPVRDKTQCRQRANSWNKQFGASGCKFVTRTVVVGPATVYCVYGIYIPPSGGQPRSEGDGSNGSDAGD